jgi:hypothetical protein
VLHFLKWQRLRVRRTLIRQPGGSGMTTGIPLAGKGRRKAVLAILVAGVIGVPLWTKALIESRVEASLARLGLKGQVAVDPFSGRATLTGIRGPLGEGAAIELGALTLLTGAGLVGPALAAQDVTLSNLTITTGSSMAVTADMVQVVLSSLDKAQLEKLFDPADSRPVAARLADLSASAIISPEVVVRQLLGKQQSRFSYRDIQLSKIVGGRFAEGRIASGAFELVDQDFGKISGVFSNCQVTDGDMVLMAEVMAGGQSAPRELKTLYASGSTGPIQVSLPDGTQSAIARIAFQDYRARPIRKSWSDLAASLEKRVELSELPPAERAQYVNDVIAVLGAFEIGSAQITDVKTTPPASASAASSIAKITYATTAQGADFTIEGLEAGRGNENARIGTIAITGWSMKAMLEAMGASLGNPDVDFDDIDFRLMLPEFQRFALRDASFAAPDPTSANKGSEAALAKLSLQSFEVTLGQPLNGVPSAFAIALDTLKMTIPADTQVPSLKEFIALGYPSLNLSGNLDSRWNEATSELVLGDVSVSGTDMGRAGVSAAFGNVSRDVFSGNGDEAQLALLAATVKSLQIGLDDKGLMERVIAREARKRNESRDKVRKEFSAAAAVLIPGMLGTSAGAKAIGKAVTSFISKPGRLTIAAKAKSPEGLGLADYIAAGSPQELLELMEVTATAE